MVVGSARRAAKTPEELAAERAVTLDLPHWHAMLIDAGAELLPLLREISTECPSEERREEIAHQMWPLLRAGWAGWWRLFQVWDRPEAWWEWERCMGRWSDWQKAGLEGLVKYWMERTEEPYKIMPEEVAMVNRWLYGTSFEAADRPIITAPFWVTEMLNPTVPW